jgi:hypothetical protein
MTGAWQDVHGQATNYDPRPVGIEHLFQLARAAGRSTALAAGAPTHTLFEPHVERRAVYEELPETAPFALYEAALRAELEASRALARGRPDLAQLELNAVDEAGHGWGAASPEYAKATSLVDTALGDLAADVDLERETLVVTSDHGHVAAGGHGGPEPEVTLVPLVLAGRGVRPGAAGTCAQVDIAATVAVLLGLPLPAASQGVPLLDALDIGPEARRAVLANVVRQRDAFVSAYSARLARLAPGGADAASARPASAPQAQTEEALAGRLATLAGTETRTRDAVAARASVGRRRQAVLVLAAVAALLAAGFRWLGGTRAEVAATLAAGLAGIALHHAGLPLLGLDYSLTAVNKDEWLRSFFMKDMALGVAACALAAFAVCAWARRRGGGWPDLCRLAWLCAALFCAAFVTKAAFSYSRQDVFSWWALPDQYWGMAFYLDVLVVMAVGLASPALVLVAGLARLFPAAPGDMAAVAAR